MDRQHLKEYLRVQAILAIHSPGHLNHLQTETGRSDFLTSEMLMHFASHQNHRGRSFASVFSSFYKKHEKEILSDNNLWFAGIFFKRKPSLIEATLYYFAYRKIFGLSIEKLPKILAETT